MSAININNIDQHLGILFSVITVLAETSSQHDIRAEKICVSRGFYMRNLLARLK